jgi:hypothetical protein
MDYISGEKLQEIADISIALNIKGNYDSDLVKTQLNNINTKCYVFAENNLPPTLPADIVNAKIIFVYSHILKYFFKNIFYFLNSPITLISHNGDDGIDESFLEYIESPILKKWFCQNRYISHKKLYSLPIGIGNRQWPHGDFSLLKHISQTTTDKTNLIYKNFNINTNSYKRHYCNDVTNNNGIPMQPQCNIIENWQATAKSFFSICPHGNGIDSHRIWECLYLNTVPVVEYHECFSQFTDLPILFVDDYSIVTYEYLEHQKPNFTHRNIEKLDINYWKNLIKN